MLVRCSAVLVLAGAACASAGAAPIAPPGATLPLALRTPAKAELAAGVLSLPLRLNGREHVLELQRAERAMQSAARWAPDAVAQGFQAWQGRVAGDAGSWVRLSTQGAGWSGAIALDGELWLVERASAAQAFGAPTDAGRSDTVAMRLSGLGLEFGDDARAFAPRGKAATSVGRAKSFTRRLALTLVLDVEFGARYANASLAAADAIAIAHTIDGFYSAAVGLEVELVELRALGANGTLTSRDPEILLDAFTAYTAAAPRPAAGSAQLLSGKDFSNDPVIGVAWVGGACDAEGHASGVNQATFGVAATATTVAHEIGHNLGIATHDPGPGYIMSPGQNIETPAQAFSPDSLAQFATFFAQPEAACLVPSIDLTLRAQAPVSSPGIVYAGIRVDAGPVSAMPMTAIGNGRWQLELQLASGNALEVVYHRGGAATTETLADGNTARAPRQRALDYRDGANQIGEDVIENWRDPYLVDASPPEGADTLFDATRIELAWSQAMPADLGACLSIVGPLGEVPGTLSFDAVRATHTFVPASPLEKAVHTLAVADCIDAGGDAQRQSLATSFRAAGPAYPVGGQVSGLAPGSKLRLQLNGSDEVVVTADGPFQFDTPVVEDDAYRVSVLQSPVIPSQTCTVANGSGTIGAPVEDVAVDCRIDHFMLRGDVRGLVGDAVQLRLNGGNDLVLSADGSFRLGPLPDLAPYHLSVALQPRAPSQQCTVTGGSGTIAGGDVSGIRIDCSTGDFRIVDIDGGGQRTELGAAFAAPLQLRVLDAIGDPVSVGEVRFEAPLSGASARFEDGVQPPAPTLAVSLDGDGGAAVIATAQVAAGCYEVRATHPGASVRAIFTLGNLEPLQRIHGHGFETGEFVVPGPGTCPPR